MMVEYQQNCDQCQNHRFGKLGLLLEAFIQIPEPPVISIPKWPDLVVDLSNIQTGVDILWPDVVFRPEPIKLPNIPTFTLPEVIPDIAIDLPDLELGFDPNALPTLVLPELPDLPELPLPELPDLPRPPRITRPPDILIDFAADLREIFRVICLVTTGLVPVPEWGLAAEIETLTQPSVDIALPILKNFGVQTPPIETTSVKEVRVETKLKFEVDTITPYETVKRSFDNWNDEIRNNVQSINGLTTKPYGNVITNLLQQAVDEAANAVDDAVDNSGVLEDLENDYVDVDVNLQSSFLELESAIENYNQRLDDLELFVAEMEDHSDVEEIYLSAKNNLIAADDPLLHRDLSELEFVDVEGLSGYNKELSNFRNDLLAYANGVSENPESLDYSTIFDNSQRPKFAGKITNSNKNEESFSLLGENTERKIMAAADETQRLIANIEGADEQFSELEDYQNQDIAKGWFIAGENGSVNVLAYKDELSSIKNTFIDVDDDGDDDLVYSLGKTIFIKENGLIENEKSQGRTRSEDDVADYVDYLNAVSFTINNEKVIINDDREGEYYLHIWSNYNEDSEVIRIDRDYDLGELEDGNYKISVVLSQGGRESVVGKQLPFRKDSCQDENKPLPVVDEYFEIPLFSTAIVDASNSFDPDGEIVEYRLKISEKDEEDSKSYTNFPNVIFAEQGTFEFGPFVNDGDLGEWQADVEVVDSNGNVGKREIIINVIAPVGQITEVDERSIFGVVSPSVEGAPISIMRQRPIPRLINGDLTLVEENILLGTINSDVNSTFYLNNLEVSDLLEVRNQNGEVIAEINSQNGNLVILDNSYSARVIEANVPDQTSYIEIIDRNSNVLATINVRASGNQDVGLERDESLGVYLIDVNLLDDFIGEKENSSINGDSGLIRRGDNIFLKVDAKGSIVLNSDNVRLEKKQNDISDFLTIDVYIDEVLRFEIVYAGENELKFNDQDSLPLTEVKGVNSSEFSYISALKDQRLQRLHENFTLQPEAAVTREQFVKVLLEMLCIVPREEAYLAYEEGTGYFDIEYSDNLDTYYPYIKEATLLGLVDGYAGEMNENGLTPFKPKGVITRAEAAKIILEAMEMKDLITLDNVNDNIENDVWYREIISVAINLNQVAKDGEFLINDYLLSVEEASSPDTLMDFATLQEMVQRVLSIYDCTVQDDDNDGLSNYCEIRFGIDDPDLDADNDGLSNALECEAGLDPTAANDLDSDEDGLTDVEEILIYLTNPFDADSDNGGVGDGAEVQLNRDPLNGLDDFGERETSNEAGVFVEPGECNICPCLSTISPKSDIISGDILTPIVSKDYEDRKVIFSVGEDYFVTE